VRGDVVCGIERLPQWSCERGGYADGHGLYEDRLLADQGQVVDGFPDLHTVGLLSADFRSRLGGVRQ
jgi:hypothetical protein